MLRISYLAFVFLVFAPPCLFAQSQSTATLSSGSGLKLSAVPEVVVAHLPDLPAGKGAWVERVDPKSPAYQGGLRKHDIIVRVAEDAVLSARHCAEKLAKVKSGDSIELTIFRGGQEMTIAISGLAEEGNSKVYSTPKSFLKPGGPPAVSVQCQPKDNGKLDITILYYANNSGKLDSLSLSGALGDIETE